MYYDDGYRSGNVATSQTHHWKICVTLATGDSNWWCWHSTSRRLVLLLHGKLQAPHNIIESPQHKAVGNSRRAVRAGGVMFQPALYTLLTAHNTATALSHYRCRHCASANNTLKCLLHVFHEVQHVLNARDSLGNVFQLFIQKARRQDRDDQVNVMQYYNFYIL